MVLISLPSTIVKLWLESKLAIVSGSHFFWKYGRILFRLWMLFHEMLASDCVSNQTMIVVSKVLNTLNHTLNTFLRRYIVGSIRILTHIYIQGGSPNYSLVYNLPSTIEISYVIQNLFIVDFCLKHKYIYIYTYTFVFLFYMNVDVVNLPNL